MACQARHPRGLPKSLRVIMSYQARVGIPGSPRRGVAPFRKFLVIPSARGASL
jgi:hypothetical protein